MTLSATEETVMEIIWANEKVFMNEILEAYDEPKPAPSTIATLLKRMQDKGFVGYEKFGNSRQYFAKVPKNTYFSKQLKGMINNFFDNSPMEFASFFTKSTSLSNEQLEELKGIIDQEIKKNSK